MHAFPKCTFLYPKLQLVTGSLNRTESITSCTNYNYFIYQVLPLVQQNVQLVYIRKLFSQCRVIIFIWIVRVEQLGAYSKRNMVVVLYCTVCGMESTNHASKCTVYVRYPKVYFLCIVDVQVLVIRCCFRKVEIAFILIRVVCSTLEQTINQWNYTASVLLSYSQFCSIYWWFSEVDSQCTIRQGVCLLSCTPSVSYLEKCGER